jgi:hypothetical protein
MKLIRNAKANGMNSGLPRYSIKASKTMPSKIMTKDFILFECGS